MEDAKAPAVSGYNVGRLLGEGGTASVWLAEEQRTGRKVALKCFRGGPGGAHGSEGLEDEAIRREIRILSVLNHEHLVKAHQAVRYEGGTGGAALVMDYASGGSLADLIAARGRLSVGETVTVLTPIAQALGYLHTNGFTHADVSPGNVLFTGQGKPLLSDVGIARMAGEAGRPESWGTAGFLDPAPVDAVRAGLQPERDVYSAAALGWYCLTGEAPARTADRPPLTLLVPEVPRDLAAALESGLAEDRRLRPTAAALATAVYRSAPPRPLDLAAAVHPTVMPELVTRRHVAPSSALDRMNQKLGVGEKLAGCRRRLHTAGGQRALRLPFPAAGDAPAHGKHALKPGPFVMGGKALRWALPALAVLAAAAALWGLAGTLDPLPSAMGNANASTGAPPAATEAPAAAAEAAGAARVQASDENPARALAGLAALRDLAFTSGKLDLLEEVNAAGSPAAEADKRTADRLRGAGLVLGGLSSTLSGVDTEDGATADRAVVRATAATSAYQELDARGSVVATGAADAGRPLRLVLVSVDGAWRISEILPG
ncbi:serine/threonine-protein kinase [Arthrobacter sp. MPF02]|uniref:serine/threonine-protein kinase n=1 Tax=Arthrobacter sp. MPF02 TaxID=3388492 RepID=UPI0039849F05